MHSSVNVLQGIGAIGFVIYMYIIILTTPQVESIQMNLWRLVRLVEKIVGRYEHSYGFSIFIPNIFCFYLVSGAQMYLVYPVIYNTFIVPFQ